MNTEGENISEGEVMVERDEKRFTVDIVVPVHNESSVLEGNIRAIVAGFSAMNHFDWRILIAENGSTDDTPAIAARLSEEIAQVEWVKSPIANYGAAMREGFLASKADIIVNFDIDYWDLEFVAVVAHVMKVKYDIIIASKNLLLSEDRRGLMRKLVSYGFRMILFFIFGLRVSDTHGIKAWRNTPRMRHFFDVSSPSHHTYDTEVIIRAMHENCEVLEIPVEILETRVNSRHILKRVPQALREILALHLAMRRES